MNSFYREKIFDSTHNKTMSKPLELCEKAGATTYYWYYKSLEIAKDIDTRDGMSWKLSLCLLGAWVLVTGCMIKGIKSTGKVRHTLIFMTN